jgi:hypothetical protein
MPTVVNRNKSAMDRDKTAQQIELARHWIMASGSTGRRLWVQGLEVRW